MTLTIGTGPFGPQAGGTFNFTREGPAHTLYFENSPKRVRARFGGETVADSRAVKLLHETGHTPVYYFPQGDVRLDLLEPTDHTTHCPFKGDAAYWSVKVDGRTAEDAVWGYPQPIDSAAELAGYVAFYWNEMDKWLEEDEVVGVHARDPYHRIDVLDSSRHIVVRLDAEVIADSTRPKILYETGLPPRYYLPADDVRTDALTPSDTTSECPYKGTASYRSVNAGGQTLEDLVWTYPEPRAEVTGIEGLLCFYNERVDLEIDGESLERPQTRFS